MSFWLVGTFVVAIATLLSALLTGVYLYLIYGLTGDELLAWKGFLIAKRSVSALQSLWP
jgi:hypothetical protein